jgi:8-oxo-dGTP pyrophosphatase MutT (NUDIX family)
MPAEFYDSLPKMQVAAGCIFLDGEGRVLLVMPTYTDGWQVPGGAVEARESPLAACKREVGEELGLDVKPGRLLAVDYRQHVRGRPFDALRFLFFGGVLSDDVIEKIRLPGEELSEYTFVALANLADYAIPVMVRRIRACFVEGDIRPDAIYLEEGYPVLEGAGT